MSDVINNVIFWENNKIDILISIELGNRIHMWIAHLNLFKLHLKV